MTEWTEELSLTQCLEVLYGDCVGRVAMTTSSGPRIVPVNYAMHHRDIIIRTGPRSELARYGVDRLLAFEVDRVHDQHHATAVIARGVATSSPILSRSTKSGVWGTRHRGPAGPARATCALFAMSSPATGSAQWDR